ncbi:MAG: hypothetical protein C0501_23375 [Isosphaera sp.]|nr:hypothetical protein [Isosphaera sp.]
MNALVVATLSAVAALTSAEPPTAARVAVLARLPSEAQTLSLGVVDGAFRFDADTPLGRAEVARARAAVDRNPADPDALSDLATALERVGDRPAAEGIARRLVDVRKAGAAKAPNDPKAQGCLATALLCAGDRAGAEAAARRAVKLAPDEPGPRVTLAWVLLGPDRAGAVAALDQAIALSPADELDLRLVRAWLRADAAMRALNGDGPAGGGAFGRVAAAARVRTALREADDLLAEAAKRLKAQDGKCGQTTRDRCLGLLMTRDLVRFAARNLAGGGGGAGRDPVLTDDTVDLIRQIVPPTSDDPVRLLFAAFAESGAVPGAGPDEPAPAARQAAAPYLRRLAALSGGTDPAAAATAAFLHGLGHDLLGDAKAAEAAYRDAVRIEPRFDLAWRGLIKAAADREDAPGRLAVARAWADRAGTPAAWLALASARAGAADWAAAEEAVRTGLGKHPGDPALLLAKVACRLRSATPWSEAQEKDVLEAVGAASTGVDRSADRDLRGEFNRTVALVAARVGEPARGREFAEEYARTADDAADSRAVLALFPERPADKGK